MTNTPHTPALAIDEARRHLAEARESRTEENAKISLMVSQTFSLLEIADCLGNISARMEEISDAVRQK